MKITHVDDNLLILRCGSRLHALWGLLIVGGSAAMLLYNGRHETMAGEDLFAVGLLMVLGLFASFFCSEKNTFRFDKEEGVVEYCIQWLFRPAKKGRIPLADVCAIEENKVVMLGRAKVIPLSHHYAGVWNSDAVRKAVFRFLKAG